MFRQSKRRTAGRRNFEQSRGEATYLGLESKVYALRLSFYDIQPLEEITLEEFETWAIDRLKVLIEIESCTARSKSLKETIDAVKPLLLKFLPLSPASSTNAQAVYNERRKDHYSHFILRLVFCRSEDLRRKFVKNEAILFKVRYNLLQPKEQQEFIRNNHDKLPWHYISAEEKADMFEELYAATSGTIRTLLMAQELTTITNEQLQNHIRTKEEFIKIPFEKVLALVLTRSIYVHDGFGYIPTSSQLNLLAEEFLTQLHTVLVKTFQSLPRLEEDDRIVPLLNNLSQNFTSLDYGATYGEQTSAEINAVSVTLPAVMQHYPMCARHLQKNMILNSHLRYNGRSQLTVFLKGIGLSLDEALKFWEHLFTTGPNAMTPDTFNKQYAYNIRHSYGKEGGRINERPWDCGKILSKPRPNKNEYHGCPYRDLLMDALTQNLSEMGVKDPHDVNAVLDQVQKSQYTIACTTVFELTHKKQLANSKSAEGLHITHPNLYCDRSKQLERAEAKTDVKV